MINTDSNTVIKYRKSISTPINKGDKIRLSSFMFHAVTATWVGSGCLPRLYCQWSGRVVLVCISVSFNWNKDVHVNDNRRKLHRVNDAIKLCAVRMRNANVRNDLKVAQ